VSAQPKFISDDYKRYRLVKVMETKLASGMTGLEGRGEYSKLDE